LDVEADVQPSGITNERNSQSVKFEVVEVVSGVRRLNEEEGKKKRRKEEERREKVEIEVTHLQTSGLYVRYSRGGDSVQEEKVGTGLPLM